MKERGAWVEELSNGCESLHFPIECAGAHYRQGRRRADGKIRLAVPQVLMYSFDEEAGTVMPVTIISDAGKDVNELYGFRDKETDPPEQRLQLVLESTNFPIRSTSQFLNHLATELQGVEIERDNRATLVAVMEAMWARSGRPGDLSELVWEWIRTEARICNQGMDCDVVPWVQYPAA